MFYSRSFPFVSLSCSLINDFYNNTLNIIICIFVSWYNNIIKNVFFIQNLFQLIVNDNGNPSVLFQSVKSMRCINRNSKFIIIVYHRYIIFMAFNAYIFGALRYLISYTFYRILRLRSSFCISPPPPPTSPTSRLFRIPFPLFFSVPGSPRKSVRT